LYLGIPRPAVAAREAHVRRLIPAIQIESEQSDKEPR
jgi:hypothetical protein